ncbi:class I SAM-dependent methyltransferase [Roseibacterium sp. SDUM158017]|uniref:class I SAM-dependent methyltransferase n=1 Tax=Roseicyclus salinarum TaxID=3036773 RepID=UPI0024155788|nr:class I SAM-dependent methyltransferase [Roseibacterium sp. SDUM158017]MDG4648619.1 class I SAM-dependent methyltransferase [Roseibacterium sp. SDUM158017]
MNETTDAGFWDRTARKYVGAAVADQAGYARTLGRTGDLLRAGDRVVELGCGTGSTAMTLGGAVRSYLATDISPTMIAIAQDRLAAAPVDGIEFRVATAADLSRGAPAADAVLAFNVLHLVRDLDATLRHVRDMLGPDGLFVSKTPCVGDMSPLIRWAVLPAMRAVGRAPFVTVFDAGELRARISDAGFEVLTVENHAGRGNDDRPFIVARRR